MVVSREHPAAVDEAGSSALVAPWEVHSELVLVSREVWERARARLPDREPYAFLERRGPAAVETAMAAHVGPVAVVGYTLWRLLETARIAAVAVAGVIALALLAELSH